MLEHTLVLHFVVDVAQAAVVAAAAVCSAAVDDLFHQ
jgi:hypothetical protein